MIAAYLALLSTCLVGSATAQLHRSFYGIAYSPDDVILPNCGAVQSKVTADIVNLAQLTPRIRLYGSDCNQTALVLQGIKDAGNVDLSVWLGVFIDGNATVYQRQMDAVLDAIKVYGTEHIAGITVGNEFLLNSYGDSSPTSEKGLAARDTLLGFVKQTNDTVTGLKLDKRIPISVADAGSAVTTALCAGIDEYFANVHAWFASVPINEAANFTGSFFKTFDVDVCAQAPNKPLAMIGEAGWPTESMNASLATNGPSIASVANLQTFLDTWVCAANKNNTPYFFFEYQDETWKTVFGGVEPFWGLFNANRTMKDIKIPDCTVTSPTGRSVNDTLAATPGNGNANATNSGGSSGKAGSGSTGASAGKVSSSPPLASMMPLAAISTFLGVVGTFVLL